MLRIPAFKYKCHTADAPLKITFAE